MSVSQSAVLQGYTDRLAEELVGTYSRRSAIIEEVMDGLECAAEENLAGSSGPEEAARRAVEEWGPPNEVASAYNDATLRISSQRLSRTAVRVVPLLAATWASALLGGPAGPWEHHPPALLTGLALLAFGTVLSLAGAISGLSTGRGMRAAAAPRGETPAAGTLAAILGLLCALLALVGLLLNRGLSHPESLDWPAVSVPAVITVLAAGYFVRSLKSFVSVLRAVGRQ
ncbi:permease prefix domain 1-containing protein [Kitasatospora sp. NPDC056531]|uniref:permease prefix domain 1-containing protein n=1 Tax=Kitasatospora sp. NPDC056531 TaxID=3345856 RepID=UPI0036C22553